MHPAAAPQALWEEGKYVVRDTMTWEAQLALAAPPGRHEHLQVTQSFVGCPCMQSLARLSTQDTVVLEAQMAGPQHRAKVCLCLKL